MQNPVDDYDWPESQDDEVPEYTYEYLKLNKLIWNNKYETKEKTESHTS